MHRSDVLILLLLLSLLILSPVPAHSARQPGAVQLPTENGIISPEERRYLDEKGGLTLCVDPDWLPYERLNRAGKHEGIAADFFNLLSTRLGIPIEVIPTGSWQATLDLARAGGCDLVSLLNENPERTEYLNFTDPLVVSPTVLVSRANARYAIGLEALAGTPMAVVKGYWIEDILHRAHPDIPIIYAASIADALEIISAGKADVMLGSLIEVTDTIQRRGLTNLKIAGHTPYNFLLRIGVRKDDPRLLTIMQKAVRSLTPLEKNEILRHWIAIRYEHRLDARQLLWVILAVGAVVVTTLLWVRRLQLENRRRQRLIGKLETALAEIKTLRGIIPICSVCKHIRTDSGAWQQIETYVREHSEADFTHGICPDCARNTYGIELKKKPEPAATADTGTTSG
ncbi:MAG: transporter substrate-binding domain-containing protein [Deltaproteobacteria bacterium]|nr:transporter substrate-binding domain-containing protein [Candidatus Anaeroferrophillacea bacterium]